MNAPKTKTSHDSTFSAVKLRTSQGLQETRRSTRLHTQKQATFSSAGQLNASELHELRACEVTIKKGWEAFVEVGKALQTIRDGRLYRNEYGTFETYCIERWGYGRAHAYRYIEAAEVVKDVSLPMSPKGDKIQGVPNLAQARELFAAPKERRAEIWKMANVVAGQNPITAKLVRNQMEAAGIRRESKTAPPKTPPQKVTLSSERIRSLLHLIDLAEQTAKEKDFCKVEDIHRKLRQQLVELTCMRMAQAEAPRSLATSSKD